jgi:hypothetical protein
MHRMAGCYFAAQSAGIFGWWLMLYFFPGTRLQFFPPIHLEQGLTVWWAADMLVVFLPSCAAGFLAFSRKRAAIHAGLIAIGGLFYASVHCAAWAFAGGPWLPLAIMGPATAVTIVATCALSRLA